MEVVDSSLQAVESRMSHSASQISYASLGLTNLTSGQSVCDGNFLKQASIWTKPEATLLRTLRYSECCSFACLVVVFVRGKTNKP